MEVGRTRFINLQPGQTFKYRGYFYARSERGRLAYKDVFNDLKYSKAVSFSPFTHVNALNLICYHDLPMK